MKQYVLILPILSVRHKNAVVDLNQNPLMGNALGSL